MNGTTQVEGTSRKGGFPLNIQSFTEFPAPKRVQRPKGVVKAKQRKTSYNLPAGAQGQLIDAALLAERAGANINRLTTIRTERLQQIGHGIFADQHEADAIKGFLELSRHWHTKRGIPWACIWVREVGETINGHLHMGSHLIDDHTEAFIEQMALWTGEIRVFPAKHKPDEIGISQHRNWLVQCCRRKGQSGTDVAAYLGKDEPSRIVGAWGKSRDNKAKRITRYPCAGGILEGTIGAAYRHGTSRTIAPASAAGKKVLETIPDAERYIGRSDGHLDWLPY